MLEITDAIAIPEDELTYTAARASGPGGQHVNTTATAVTVIFNVARSPSLSPLDKMIIRGKLARRINKKGQLMLTARGERSQAANKREVTKRLERMLRKALEPVKKRIPTGPTRASKERRVQAKKQRGTRKRLRRITPGDFD